MLFNEVYGSYYNIVTNILREAVRGELTQAAMLKIIRQEGFEESTLTIPAALKEQSWPLLTEDLKTPLRHEPAMPLTLLQKRWLKTLLQDPRIKLFRLEESGLEEVESLYSPECFVYYDRYSDGDNFMDKGYQERFHKILTGLQEERRISVSWKSGKGNLMQQQGTPYRIEYSPKDDKFRLLLASGQKMFIINMARLQKVKLLDFCELSTQVKQKKREAVLELKDERNALERIMLHFSHLEKETEQLDEEHYRLTFRYFAEEETEILIRILSFGPMIKVVAPESLQQSIRERIGRQMRLQRSNDINYTGSC